MSIFARSTAVFAKLLKDGKEDSKLLETYFSYFCKKKNNDGELICQIVRDANRALAQLLLSAAERIGRKKNCSGQGSFFERRETDGACRAIGMRAEHLWIIYS